LLPVLFLVLCLASVPLARGRLWALGELRFRAVWAIFLGVALQFTIIRTYPSQLPDVQPYIHVGTYLLAGYFFLANRKVPGFWLIALGGALNLVAIVANGGTMPASGSALATAGLVKEVPHQFLNSAALGSPNLSFLGDIFAVPKSVPFSNVFSLGDVCIGLGTFVGLHRVCGSRLLPPADGEFSALVRERNFVRVWAGLAASHIGDFAYSITALVSLSGHGFGASVFATLLIAQVAPASVVGLLGAQLVDRFSRKRLMILADVVRAGAVATLLVVPSPTPLHFYVVAACLGSFGALFRPSLGAALPNIVPPRLLVAANSALTATFNLAVMIGPALGGLLAAHLGVEPTFALDAGTFLFSATLLVRLRGGESPGLVMQARAALVEGVRYSLSTPLVRVIMVVTGVGMVAAAIRSPLEPLFILKAIHGHPQDLGFAEACWGLGMVLGSIASPSMARRWRRMRLVATGMGTIGLSVLGAAVATSLFTVLLLWLAAGFGNAMVTVSYSSLLQERTPDRVRGRVVAASDALLDGAIVAGALSAGWLGAALGVRGAFVVSGTLFLGAASLGHVLPTFERVPRRRGARTEPGYALTS
jgi:MFS family permease